MTYFASLVELFMIEGILIAGLSFSYGTAGILNFTYITFVAIGAYIGAIFTIGPPANNPGLTYVFIGTLPWPVNVLVGGLAAAVAGALLSVGMFRGLRSDYLAIVTVAAGYIFYTVVGDSPKIFNGYQGLFGISPPSFTQQGGAVVSLLSFAAICCGWLVIIIAGLLLVYKSPLGRALRAIREDGDLVGALGRNVFAYRFWSLVVSCGIAGIGGALLGEYSTAFNPNAFLPPETFILYAAVILGGAGNIWGAMLGAAVVPVGIEEATRFLPQIGSATVVEELRGLVIGIVLIIILAFRQEGLIPEKAMSILKTARERTRPSRSGVATALTILGPRLARSRRRPIDRQKSRG